MSGLENCSGGVARFVGNAGILDGLRLDIDESVRVKVERLDQIIEEDVTFVKMDIEGAEEGCYNGLLKFDQKNHPKLAISIYHRPKDIFEIPKTILKIDDIYILSQTLQYISK